MSSIPVRRATTRVTRSARDTENINARPSRSTTRAKSALSALSTAGAASTTVTSTAAVNTRATASTAASKAKSAASTTTTEAAGAKRKREILVEVTGLVTNNKGKSTGAAGLKGKEKESAGNTTTKTAKTAVKPSGKTGGVTLRRGLRSASESTTISNSKTDTDRIALEQDEKMEVDDPLDVPPPPPVAFKRISRVVGEEGLERVFKKRHTEKRELEILDESQLEADKVAADLVEETVAPVAPSGQLWDDLDAEDWDDPVMVNEYVVEVCVYLKQVELAMLPNPDYMDKQGEITWEHRGILIDWLLQVHTKFGLTAESLFLTVNVLDRFLGQRTIAITKLQLVGLAAFLIATKFEETYAPSVKEIAYLADNQYTMEEILKAEKYILKILEWDLKAPGPMGWLRRGSKADGCEVQARTVAKYLLEIGCLERKLIGVVPSKVSAAALWLARLALGRDEWTANLEHYTTYSEEELLPVANLMVEYMITTPIPHESLFKKYAQKRYFRCSSFMIQWSLARWPENGQVDLSKDLAHLKEEIAKDLLETQLQGAA